MSLSRKAWTAVFASLIVACALYARGQTAGTGQIVGFFAPRAIDVGIIPRLSRSPDSPESRIRSAFHNQQSALDRVGARGAHYVAGKLIVKFRSSASTASKLQARSVAAASDSTQPSYANFEVMTIDPSADAEAAAAAMAARSDVEYAQPAYRVHTDFVPNDPFYNRQWNLPAIGMEQAWDIQRAAGSNITVAVLDTGVAYTNVTMKYHANAFTMNGVHFPALGDLTLSFSAAPELGPSSRFVAPVDFIWNTNVPVDLDGHGTHVSGTLGQATNNNSGTAGVAYNVKIMPVKVIDSDWDDIFGSPNSGTDDVVARGVRYAAENGAKVINMSIGRTGPPAPAIEDAINYAVGKGAFVVIAGGNDENAACSTPSTGGDPEAIAGIASRVKGAVAVAAVDRNKARAWYSKPSSAIEVAAPGGSFCGSFGSDGGILQQTLDLDLVETFNNSGPLVPPQFDSFAYFFFIGTSQATPHVSGVAAMMMQQGITSPAAVEAALEGAGPRTNDLGYGLINARTGLRGLGLAK
jgi:serine protease